VSLLDTVRPMCHLQMFTNQTVPEFKTLGLDGQVWFNHVDFETSYLHVLPMMQNMMRTSMLRAMTGNDSITITALNSPLPFPWSVHHTFNSVISAAFVEFTSFAMVLITVGII